MPSELTAAICQALDRHDITDGVLQTQVSGLRLLRTHGRVAPRQMNYRPALCVVGQGTKLVLVGDRTLTYGSMQAMVITVEVPVLGEIIEASPTEPFVCATLDLDPEIILEVLTELDRAPRLTGAAGFGLIVKDIDERLSASMLRLLDLALQPTAIEILKPAIMREIAYWLLIGPAGPTVARMVLPEGQPRRIAKAIAHLKANFNTAVSIGELASSVGMSASTFHHHFRRLTAMSPLQYQKHLRLLEARRRMVAHDETAGAAAHSVGYESLSHFSREYARMFGSPPRSAALAVRSNPSRYSTPNHDAGAQVVAA